ncbi:DUF58 domain-containing protein [Pseudofulvibacter geojedonensis]|uniref:DUF58 domain-containing protein n=1 Tax=Pseudofulvibacter geojedonensis TaxID=1123758 RepID=A0ABW3I081_9FLAO
MKKLFKSFYINRLVFFCLTGIVCLFALGHFLEVLFHLAKYLLLALGIFVFIDTLLLYNKKEGVLAKRITPEKFSNGDTNHMSIELENQYPFHITTSTIDEIPFQFQKRDFKLTKKINKLSKATVPYTLRPTQRGEYHFGHCNVYVQSPLKLILKRYTLSKPEMVKTYPSFMQLKKFDLIAFSNSLSSYGIKKIRRIGHSLEFEQIKEYIQGDDLRTLNWKATAKRNQLMVNQYQDEKSQAVYSIIDKGRVMQMPFNGLSLLDYAINATLVVSNVILKKQDKAGMFAFSKKVENVVVAERRTSQMSLLLESLYNIKTNFFESDYSRLYADLKRNITHRSLLILYTNFETIDGLNRQLPYLRAIAKNHLLVVVFFKNTELKHIIQKEAYNIKEVYDKVVAEKFLFEKKQIVSELNKYGIHTILTEPENLSVDTINKYLELKSRGLH